MPLHCSPLSRRQFIRRSVLGGLAILLMLFAPSGVWGVISQAFDISLFPVRRRLIAPGNVAKEKESSV